MHIGWPTHKYRIMTAGHKVHEGDNLLVALEHFGSLCGEADNAPLLRFIPDKHDVTGEPILEARYGTGGQLYAVLYGVTLDQWSEHGKHDGQPDTNRPASNAG